MYHDTTFPPADAPGRMKQFLRLLEAFQRDEIETGVDLLIEALDRRDGDADLEDDERAGMLMAAPGVDFDPDEHEQLPDGLPGDPVDAEDEGHSEPSGDERDASFPEWRAGDGARATVFEKGTASALHDEDAEDDDSDRCYAGDDHIIAGPVMNRDWWERYDRRSAAAPGDADDQEHACPPAYMIDQTRDLYVTAANDWPEAAS